MNNLFSFFSKLFDTDGWIPRWVCGHWTTAHGWLYIISSLLIWAAYFTIPFILFRVVRQRKKTLPFQRIFWLFIFFIFACGITHFIDAIIFWYPIYRFSAIVLALTAIVSWAAVLGLYKVLPVAFTFKTPVQYEAIIQERTAALEATNQDLQEVNRKLEEANEAAHQLMYQKDEFMSIASHELKTPVTSLKANLQMVERIANSNAGYQELTPFIKQTNKQVARLTGLIEDLLDITRIQAGQLKFNYSEFKLSALIDECLQQAKAFQNNHAILVEGNVDVDIIGDRSRLEQVIVNLLSNAIKYSPNADKIIVSVSHTALEAQVAVTDFGVGIPDDKIPHIFDRFFRAREVDSFTGLGLGLYISSEIIKRHGGNILVQSSPGEGSTFTLHIPLLQGNQV